MSPTPSAVALIGLGKMGANMARRLARGGVTVHGYDTAAETRQALSAEYAQITAHDSLASTIAALPQPRLVWLMLPAGEISEHTLSTILPLLSAGDVVIDGANAYYKDSQARAARLRALGIGFVDAGVSGGVWGGDNGYTIMLGGSEADIARVRPLVEVLAPAADRGWLHCGPNGAGHYVKMVHNGIEYGMMQAFAEGFALMEAKQDLNLDLAAVSEVWRHGSVIRSWLLDLTADTLQQDTTLSDIQPKVPDSGEGRWTVLEAVELGVPAPVISNALFMRFASQGKHDYASKLLAMMRKAFGGHAVGKA